MALIYEAEADRQRPQQDADQALLILRERIARDMLYIKGRSIATITNGAGSRVGSSAATGHKPMH